MPHRVSMTASPSRAVRDDPVLSNGPRRMRLHGWVWCGLGLSLCVSAACGAGGGSAAELPDVYSADVARFERLLASSTAEQRVEGIQGLSHLKHWPAEDLLIERLRDRSAQVRFAAVSALCRLGTTRAVPHLIRLLDEPDWHTRRQVHLALCRMTAESYPDQRHVWATWWNSGTPESRQRDLLAMVTSAEPGLADGPTRVAAWRALTHLAGPDVEQPLVQLLETAQQPPLNQDERRFALEVLERVGTERAVPILAWYGHEAAWALGRIGGPRSEAALLECPLTLPVLVNLDRLKSNRCGPLTPQLVQRMGLVTFRSQPDDLHASPTPIQRVAANLIRRGGAGPELIDAILAELEATSLPNDTPRPLPEPPEYLRELMGRFREELAPGFVRNDGVTTSQPLSALYHVAEDPALSPRLIPLLRHPAFVPRIYVALTLAKLDAVDSLPEMLALLGEGYPFCDAATLVSGKHFDQSQSVRWRGFLCMAIGRLGGEDARRALETFASDPDEFRDIRYGAVVGLSFIADPQSLPVLNQVAQRDPIWMVRDAAHRACVDIQLRTETSSR